VVPVVEGSQVVVLAVEGSQVVVPVVEGSQLVIPAIPRTDARGNLDRIRRGARNTERSDDLRAQPHHVDGTG
jgi:hypothetical protein